MRARPVRAARAAWAARSARDEGVSLVELLVSMAVMSICMVMFTAGILQMYRLANRDEAASGAQSQLNIAFLRLDKEIRYASAVSTPGAVGVNPYVEYLTTGSGTPVCAELRLHVGSGQLQRRTWTQAPLPVAPTAWLPLASGLSGAQPFTVYPPDATYPYQRLELTLTSSAGAGGNATTKQTDVTFTARNTSPTTAAGNVCGEGRAIP